MPEGRVLIRHLKRVSSTLTPAPPLHLSLKDIMMTTHHDRHCLKAGGDPRTLADFNVPACGK